MNTTISRRGCLKLLVAGGALSLAPVQILQAKQKVPAMVITANTRDCRPFTEGVEQRARPIPLRVPANELNALNILSEMSSGDLIVGLINDAQKVLVESFVSGRRGVVREVARFNTALSGSELIAIGAMTINAALSDMQNVASVREPAIGSGPLISFYGYIS